MSDLKKPESKKRDLFISDRICQSSVIDAIKEICEINRDDDQKEELYRNFERKPIRLFINSYGGGVYSGLALIDVIKRSKTPVHTVCIGSCMSMALWIWLAGEKCIIGEHGTLMFHDLSVFAIDKTEGLKQELDEMLRLQAILVSEITEKSLVKEETLRDYITRKAEWYIPAKEAIALKLADEYYK